MGDWHTEYLNAAKDAADLSVRIVALEAVLARLVRVGDSGVWRDKAGLKVSAHPAYDDARELLAPKEQA